MSQLVPPSRRAGARAAACAGALLLTVLAGAAARVPNASADDVPPNGYLLYEAATQGDTATVAHLLNDDPALAVLKFDKGVTPLHGAALADEPRTVELLLARGAFVDAHGGSEAVTPLFLACLKNHPRTAMALLAKRADPDFKGDLPGNDGDTQVRPLHLAALNGNSALARALVLRGAMIDATTGNGVTPIEYARRTVHESVRQLLAAYQRMGRVKAQPIADLIVAIDAGDSATVERAVQKTPSLVKLRLLDDWTLLHLGGFAGADGVCRVLLAHHADPRAIEKSTGLSPARRAYISGHPDLANWLEATERTSADTRSGGRPGAR